MGKPSIEVVVMAESTAVKRFLVGKLFLPLGISFEQLEKDRKDALYYEIANSDELLRCLDRQEQARYIAEAQDLIYDNNVTPQQIESRLSHWKFYRQNPMSGSERYRELYGDA